MSRLLIDEYPLMVLPKLATTIGLNEAVVIQQIHYWLYGYQERKDYRHLIEGRWWVYNTAEGWQENFPFWSTRTVQRALKALRDRGLVQVGNFNKKGYDRTLWYTINYEALDKLEESIMTQWQDGSCQNGKMDDDKVAPPIPETTPDTIPQTISEEETPDGVPLDVDPSWPAGDPVESEPTPTPPAEKSILEYKDHLSMGAEVARRTKGKKSWTVPEAAGGADPYLDGPLDATLRILRRKRDGLPPDIQAKMTRQLRRIVEGPAKESETEPPANGTPKLFLEACRLWPNEFAWKNKGKITYTNIYRGAFINDMRTLMSQIQDGAIGSGKKLVIRND